MVNPSEISQNIDQYDSVDPRERMKTTLEKLQALRNRIMELRMHCEELQEMRFRSETNALRCEECGKGIRADQAIKAENFGKKPQYYHEKCFRKLWQQ
jgi:hypothetical protein